MRPAFQKPGDQILPVGYALAWPARAASRPLRAHPQSRLAVIHTITAPSVHSRGPGHTEPHVNKHDECFPPRFLRVMLHVRLWLTFNVHLSQLKQLVGSLTCIMLRDIDPKKR